MRKQLRQFLIEFRIVGDDHGHRRRHRLVRVAGRQGGPQLLLALRRADEHEARGRGVGRGRTEFQQIVKFMNLLVGDGLVLPFVVGARLAEQQIVCGGLERHGESLREEGNEGPWCGAKGPAARGRWAAFRAGTLVPSRHLTRGSMPSLGKRKPGPAVAGPNAATSPGSRSRVAGRQYSTCSTATTSGT